MRGAHVAPVGGEGGGDEAAGHPPRGDEGERGVEAVEHRPSRDGLPSHARSPVAAKATRAASIALVSWSADDVLRSAVRIIPGERCTTRARGASSDEARRVAGRHPVVERAVGALVREVLLEPRHEVRAVVVPARHGQERGAVADPHLRVRGAGPEAAHRARPRRERLAVGLQRVRHQRRERVDGRVAAAVRGGGGEDGGEDEGVHASTGMRRASAIPSGRTASCTPGGGRRSVARRRGPRRTRGRRSARGSAGRRPRGGRRRAAPPRGRGAAPRSARARAGSPGRWGSRGKARAGPRHGRPPSPRPASAPRDSASGNRAGCPRAGTSRRTTLAPLKPISPLRAAAKCTIWLARAGIRQTHATPWRASTSVYSVRRPGPAAGASSSGAPGTRIPSSRPGSREAAATRRRPTSASTRNRLGRATKRGRHERAKPHVGNE